MTQSSSIWQTTISRILPHEEPSPTLLIVPGFRNSPNDHWQSLWEREREDCRRADLGQWHDPHPDAWIAALDRAVRGISGPVVLVAHSLGCIAVARWVQAMRPVENVAGALLVAPCDPEAEDALPALRRFAPVPRTPLPFLATLVASADDPYASVARSYAMARDWGTDFINVGCRGHINALSGLGGWREGQILVDDLLRRIF